MSTKSNFGWQLAAGATMLFVGLNFLWSARSALLYHVPIYFKGPSWMYPWQAIIGGSLCSACGLFLILNALYRRKKPGGDS
jgi:hypothetical protein